MEGSEDCEYDALVIALDSNYTHKLMSACNKKSNGTLITSNGNIMYVKFSSDISHAGKGFNATYAITSLKNGCGGLFVSQSGFLYSPNYPKVYNPNEVCEYRMRTDESHSIIFMFMDLDLEKTENCTKVNFKNIVLQSTLLNHFLIAGLYRSQRYSDKKIFVEGMRFNPSE
jgi:hypothetical protein